MKKNIKWILLIALIIIIICCIKFYRNTHSDDGSIPEIQKKELKIGAILPLTGDAAIAGKNTQKGIELALKLINEKNNNNDTIIVIYEDTKADPKTAISSVYKLLNNDKVTYIIDNSISQVTLSVAPIINKNKTILLATGASSPKISQAGKNIFRIWNSDNEEAFVMAKFVKDSLKANNILIIYANNEYGTGLKDAFITSIKNDSIKFKELAINDNYIIPYKKLNKFSAIYVIAHSKNTIQILKKIVEKGYKGIILGTSVMLDPNVQKEIKKLKLTTYYPTPKIPSSDNQNYVLFVNEYKKMYNENPVPLSDVGFDAVNLYYKAIHTYDTLPEYEAIFKYFNSGKEYIGASGIIKFDKNGDVHKPITINKIN